MAKKTTVKPALSKVEKFYIENNSDLSVEEICKDIKKNEKLVSEYHSQCLEKTKQADTIDKLMVVDSKNGYAVMTKEASEKGEKTRTQRSSPRDKNHIHKIRD